MKRKQKISVCLALVCLLSGSALYLLFRPTTLLMFHWADALGLTGSIGTMRVWIDGFDRYVPNWVVFSLPFALYVLSYMFFIESIWINSTSPARHGWFWCIPITAICSELTQIKHIIPGRFDLGDLFALIVAIILGFFLACHCKQNKGVT